MKQERREKKESSFEIRTRKDVGVVRENAWCSSVVISLLICLISQRSKHDLKTKIIKHHRYKVKMQ